MTAEDVQELFDGLEINGLTDDYTHVLTGTVSSVTSKSEYSSGLIMMNTRLYWKLRHFREN